MTIVISPSQTCPRWCWNRPGLRRLPFSLPELPQAKAARFQSQFGLTEVDANVLVGEQDIANFFEAVLDAGPSLPPRLVANWMTGELFGWMNTCGETIDCLKVTPLGLADLLALLEKGEINAAYRQDCAG